jgi:hypothetical protein
MAEELCQRKAKPRVVMPGMPKRASTEKGAGKVNARIELHAHASCRCICGYADV